MRVDLLRGLRDAVVVGDVDHDRFDLQAFGLQLQRGGDGLLAIAAAEQHVDAGVGELAGGLESDPARRAGDQRDLVAVAGRGGNGGHVHSPWEMANQACVVASAAAGSGLRVTSLRSAT